MSRLDGFGQTYVSTLENYLRAHDEAALSQAYELGREAMGKGLGVLDMAGLHHAALGVLAVSVAPADLPVITQSAANFFAELLSPFEMSFRGYRAANQELQRLNESLRQQKAAVELANRDLESFSYSVSHDLRAPLRAVAGFSQVLVEDFAGSLGDDGLQCVQRVRSAAQHMAKLIDSLLALARVTRSELHRTDVNLTQLADRIVHGLRASAPARTVTVTLDDDVHGDGDETLLGVVLENLLGNAWKFTSKRADAEIRFGCEQRDGKRIYLVRDNGAGFDMTAAPRLFAPFQRLHSVREFEGTGIGLATVQRVVQRHDGDVWAESRCDAGSTFYFTLGDAVPP